MAIKRSWFSNKELAKRWQDTHDNGITMLDTVSVRLEDHMGSDRSIRRAAKVSTGRSDDIEEIGVFATKEEADEHLATVKRKYFGLINYLMRKRHGSPFEHTALTFYVEAPIFVFREFHRHRIGFSYNEMSGRYTTLPARFYAPALDRPMAQTGTSANPSFEAVSEEEMLFFLNEAFDSAEEDWSRYQRLLNRGFANEMARIFLPLNINSQMYVTCNARSLMAFLSLRTKDETATFPSNPQHEIELVARQMEAIFAKKFPDTYKSFVKNGRVAP